MAGQKIRVGIVGASGYSGEELLHLLLRHPNVDVTVVTSRQYAGEYLASVFPKFSHYPGVSGLKFEEPTIDEIAAKADYFFLALPHGVAHEYAPALLSHQKRVIDLSADFRLDTPSVYQEFYGHEHPCPEWLPKGVYGLPEVNRKAIETAQLVASPGCYPTSILIPTIPLIQSGFIKPDSIIADSLSGVSGAGKKAAVPYLYVECNESLRPYGIPKHRHLSEIEQELSKVAQQPVTIQFSPHLVPVNRGILTTIYAAPSRALRNKEDFDKFKRDIEESWLSVYGSCPFVRYLGNKSLPDTKNVTGTNVIEFGWQLDERTGRLIIMSAEDNLVKGASGQAVQSFNIMNQLSQETGLI